MNNGLTDVIRTLSRYNRQVNEKIAELLARRDDLLHRKTTYFGTLLDLLAHIVIADVTWLRRIGATTTHGNPVPDISFRTLRDNPFDTFDSWVQYRRRLDEFLMEYARSLDDEALRRHITYRTSRGDEYTQPLWQILLHLFNHQTHHRGQMAQVLDDHGVDNDVSNLIWYLRDTQ